MADTIKIETDQILGTGKNRVARISINRGGRVLGFVNTTNDDRDDIANLWASATDMLEALRTVKRCRSNNGSPKQSMLHAMIQVDAAIAKAEGRA